MKIFFSIKYGWNSGAELRGWVGIHVFCFHAVANVGELKSPVGVVCVLRVHLSRNWMGI